MMRTEMPRTLLCGALTVAVLAFLAGCSTIPPQTSPAAYQPPQQIEVSPPRTEPTKAELAVPDQPAIDSWTRRFSGDKHKSFQIQLDRARDYVVPCQEIFRQRGLPEDLVYVALVESGFTPTARSRANAVGMFQFIEATGRRYRLEQNHWIDERRHPFKAARAAADYLSFLYDSFGSWPLALAGYNCGEKAVQAALDQSGLKTFWELAQRGYLPSETRDYVPKFFATVRIVREPKQYGFHFNPEHYAPKHETVAVPGGVKLAWVEKQTGVPESSLRTCNPELCQPVTPPGNTTYDLCVPIGTGATVQAALATCPLPPPEENPAPKALAFKTVTDTRSFTAPAVAPASYTVKPGDTWFSLARKYQCSVADLAACNGLQPSPQALKTGQALKIPLKGQALKPSVKNQIITVAANKDPVEKQPTPLAIPAKASRTAQKACVSYPVRPGDTLYSIAGKFHTSVEELSANNKLRQGQKLVAGNTLTICSDESPPAERVVKKKN
jgi:membrane-bound lytic murein transglycosylase D